MAHIDLPEGVPGILGPMMLRPDRYVDGLATWASTERSAYEQVAREIVAHGYVQAT